MASDNKQISIPESFLAERIKLSDEFQEAGLGTLTHEDIYRAGLKDKKAILALFLETPKKGK